MSEETMDWLKRESCPSETAPGRQGITTANWRAVRQLEADGKIQVFGWNCWYRDKLSIIWKEKAPNK